MTSNPNQTPEIEVLAKSLGLYTISEKGQTYVIGCCNIDRFEEVYSDPINSERAKERLQSFSKFCFDPGSYEK